MLILFDIDGTLIRSKYAGIHAMLDATRELFGTEFSFDGITTAGRLDPLIWNDLAAANGVDDPAAHHEAFMNKYVERFAARVAEHKPVYALPGVVDLVTHLNGRDDIVLGLLTGNYPQSGCLKVEAGGMNPEWFGVRAWGIDGSHRRDLPPVAMRRFEEIHGRAIEPERTLIIGDTPHDVDCAHHNGCQCLAVATGGFSFEDLQETGAELVVRDLSDTDRVSEWISSAAPSPR